MPWWVRGFQDGEIIGKSGCFLSWTWPDSNYDWYFCLTMMDCPDQERAHPTSPNYHHRQGLSSGSKNIRYKSQPIELKLATSIRDLLTFSLTTTRWIPNWNIIIDWHQDHLSLQPPSQHYNTSNISHFVNLASVPVREWKANIFLYLVQPWHDSLALWSLSD